MAGSDTRFAVLFFTDIVGSTDLKARHGVPAYRDALGIHNAHFERLVRESRGVRILQNMGDGYFAEGDSVAKVVKFALLFQDAMRDGRGRDPARHARRHSCWRSHGARLGGRQRHRRAGSGSRGAGDEPRGGRADFAHAVSFDEARHFLREHPPIEGRTVPPLRWLAHGPYLLKGRDEPMDIFEVGASTRLSP